MAREETPSPERANHPTEPIPMPRADTRSRYNLPAPQTSFVGRAMELAELAELLSAPECRLLTIMGPGGMGKTRLALEAARAAQEMFEDGVFFVPLRALSANETIAPALAEAIGCPLTGHSDEREQIARFLRPKRMLLVLDNFEHLLEQASWLAELLAAAPGLRLLVTSREALNLQEEWRYPLAGLAAPTVETADPEQFEAVRLFVERARRVRLDFTIEMERDGVARLCRITEGLPLALELAAAWTKTLSCAAIADEIERNVTFLATGLRNIPARHRSMQAAFDYSWALLSEDERRVFQRLAVFRGGFSREAAEQVAGATLPLLSSLVDKSLLRYESGERFHLHELLRQYAEGHLHAVPDEAERAYAAHFHYYLAFIADRFEPLTGGGQREAISEITAEQDNIRAAWHKAADVGDVEALAQASHAITLFYDFRARYGEGLALLEEGLRLLRASESSPRIDAALAAMLVDAVRLHHRLGQTPAMRVALAESEKRYAELSGPLPLGNTTDPLVWRALLTLVDGHFSEAERLSAEVVRRNTAEDRPGNLPFAWWVRAAATLWQQETDVAREYARRSTESALAIGDHWNLAYGHNMQGHVATARGEYDEARRHFEAGYAIREALDDPEGMGTGLGHLAKIAALQGDWAKSERLYQRGLAIAREINDPVTTGNALNGLGRAACARGDYAAAGQHFAEGLRLMVEAGYMRLLFTLLVSAADWLLQTGRPAEAVGPLAYAFAHPASDHETRPRAGQLLATATAALPQDVCDAAVERNRGADPAELALLLASLLTAPPPAGVTPVSQPSLPERSAESPGLAEPLTGRELEVLRLIAAGHSNREIADELFLAVNTVRSYSQQIYGKLGVSSRTRAVARARDLGLLT